MAHEIQRQSTSFAYRTAGGWEDEEWRGAIDHDYDDGRPSRADLAAEQAEDDFWEEKERDYPRGYGPPQTGDEDHDYPGWLYVDDEAPEEDEVTDLDLDEVDDFDPYEDEIGDGPLPFDTPIYNPGGGYDDYDKGLSDFEAEEDSAPDIEKFSATEEFDCDGIHNWGPNERCEDCGKEDTREPDDLKPVPKFPKKGRTNPFDRRVAWGDRTHPPAPQKKTKEPQRAIRNDDVKIMRHSETGLGYDAIVRVNEHGGYDVLKPLQRKSFRYADSPATTNATTPATSTTPSQTYGPTPMPTGLTNAITNAQSANGQSYQYGGNDCSGYMSNIYNDLTGKNERFTTDSNFTALGFQPGYDPNSHFNIGTNGLPGTEGHMAGELGGVPVESASPTGHHPGAPGVMYGGDAYSPTNPMFTQQYHLPNDLIINNPGKTSRRYSAKAEVLNAEEEGLDFGGKRWGAGCPEHGNVIGCRSKADAQRMETWEFCDDCREKI